MRTGHTVAFGLSCCGTFRKVVYVPGLLPDFRRRLALENESEELTLLFLIRLLFKCFFLSCQ